MSKASSSSLSSSASSPSPSHLCKSHAVRAFGSMRALSRACARGLGSGPEMPAAAARKCQQLPRANASSCRALPWQTRTVRRASYVSDYVSYHEEVGCATPQPWATRSPRRLDSAALRQRRRRGSSSCVRAERRQLLLWALRAGSLLRRALAGSLPRRACAGLLLEAQCASSNSLTMTDGRDSRSLRQGAFFWRVLAPGSGAGFWRVLAPGRLRSSRIACAPRLC